MKHILSVIMDGDRRTRSANQEAARQRLNGQSRIDHIIRFATACLFLLAGTTHAAVIFGNSGLGGGFRWDAAPRMIGENERSLDGGLRYSVQGGSFEAYRDLFSWSGQTPSVADVQQAIEQAFNAWTVVDPVTGLGTDLSFVADFGTTVMGVDSSGKFGTDLGATISSGSYAGAIVTNTGSFGGVNPNGAEIDLFAVDAGDTQRRGTTSFNVIGSPVTLTSGTSNYPDSKAISGADVTLNNNPSANYTLNVFRRLLTHELGHAIGLGDVEGDINPRRFIDDNYDGTDSTTALATLTNSWAALVNPSNPAASPLSMFTVPDADPGVDTFGVDILMESRGLGIASGNPVTNLTPMTNDDFGGRQFLYPTIIPLPAASWTGLTMLGSLSVVGWIRRRGRSVP